MLLTINVIRNGLSKAQLYASKLNKINKCVIQQTGIQCRRNIGYAVTYHNIYSNNDLTVINYKLISNFSSDSSTHPQSELELSPVQFEKVSDETLESLTEYFDELIEKAAHLQDADISYGDGVLTIKFGSKYGTYVINRQTPNKQIWLSSPKSGPKRYDFVNGKWIYKHDGKSLHELLNNEIPAIIRDQTNFNKCSFSGKEREAAMKTL
ncbi:frataxin [Megachile rotundata]|uniref:frataxin n=1 Tax=Megachile rotundata TaxID=143995 RepID=UPI000258D3D0|nr:PREDICTED: frataxin homolog, mitochondrial [Megachile rotundata]